MKNLCGDSVETRLPQRLVPKATRQACMQLQVYNVDEEPVAHPSVPPDQLQEPGLSKAILAQVFLAAENPGLELWASGIFSRGIQALNVVSIRMRLCSTSSLHTAATSCNSVSPVEGWCLV